MLEKWDKIFLTEVPHIMEKIIAMYGKKCLYNFITRLEKNFSIDRTNISNRVLSAIEGFVIKLFRRDYDRYDSGKTHVEAKKMLFIPFDELPLHLNSEDNLAKAIVKWRLRIRK